MPPGATSPHRPSRRERAAAEHAENRGLAGAQIGLARQSRAEPRRRRKMEGLLSNATSLLQLEELTRKYPLVRRRARPEAPVGPAARWCSDLQTPRGLTCAVVCAGGGALLGVLVRAMHANGRRHGEAGAGPRRAERHRLDAGELPLEPAAPGCRVIHRSASNSFPRARLLVLLQVEAEQVDDASAKYQIASVPTVLVLKVMPAVACSSPAGARSCPNQTRARLFTPMPQGETELARIEGADPAALASAVYAALGPADSNGYAATAVPEPAPAPVPAKPAAAAEPPTLTPGEPRTPQLVLARLGVTVATSRLCTACAAACADVEARIKELITDHPVCLFMKGTVDAPRCGFSRRVVQALQSLNVSGRVARSTCVVCVEGTRGRKRS